KILPHLLEAYQLLKDKKDSWSVAKTEDLKTVIYAVCGLFLESTAADFSSTSDISVSTVAINRSAADVKWQGVNYSTGNSKMLNKPLSFNQPTTSNDSLKLISTGITLPYWLAQPQQHSGMYPLPDEKMRALPENFPPLQACF